MLIYINAKDIRNASDAYDKHQSLAAFCPITQAMRRRVEPGAFVSTGTLDISVNDKRFRLGTAAKRLVSQFDGFKVRNVGTLPKPQHIRIYPV